MNGSDKSFTSLGILPGGGIPLDQAQSPGQRGVSDGPRDPGVQGYVPIALICFSNAFFSLYH